MKWEAVFVYEPLPNRNLIFAELKSNLKYELSRITVSGSTTYFPEYWQNVPFYLAFTNNVMH